MEGSSEDRNLIEYPAAMEWYQKVLAMFHFNADADLSARDLLYEYRKSCNPLPILHVLRDRFLSSIPLFFGAGPNLRNHLEQIVPIVLEFPNKFFIIAADGAARGLTFFKLVPHMIISDLDGLTLNQLTQFIAQDVVLAIHAHGNNQVLLQKYRFLLQQTNNIIGTTQTPPRFPILNPGGFTDGDRGIFLCHHLLPRNQPFFLFGYDFGEQIGEFSKPSYTSSQPMTPIKRQKLQFCRTLLDFLVYTEHRNLVFYGQNSHADQRILTQLRTSQI